MPSAPNTQLHARGQGPELPRVAPRILVLIGTLWATLPTWHTPHLPGVEDLSCLKQLPGSQLTPRLFCALPVHCVPGCMPGVVDLSHLGRLLESLLQALSCALTLCSPRWGWGCGCSLLPSSEEGSLGSSECWLHPIGQPTAALLHPSSSLFLAAAAVCQACCPFIPSGGSTPDCKWTNQGKVEQVCNQARLFTSPWVGVGQVPPHEFPDWWK